VSDRLTRIWGKLSEWILFIAMVAMIVLSAYAFWTIHETHQIVASHDAELAQTKALANDILRQEKVQSTNHSATLSILDAICASTPGCPAALQKMEAG